MEIVVPKSSANDEYQSMARIASEMFRISTPKA